jgi:uncharacterized protein (TIGR02265 family)
MQPSAPARVTVEVVQGLFDFLTPMSAALQLRCRELGFDASKLTPDYDLEAFSKWVAVLARERFPDLGVEQGLTRLGRENVRAMQNRNLWLSAMLPMMRLIGPHRVLSKANARRIGQTNTELLYTQTGPSSGTLTIRPCPVGAFLAGVVEQVVLNAGGLEPAVTVTSQNAAEAVLAVSWSPR